MDDFSAMVAMAAAKKQKKEERELQKNQRKADRKSQKERMIDAKNVQNALEDEASAYDRIQDELLPYFEKARQEKIDLEPAEKPTYKHIDKKNVKKMNPKQNENDSTDKYLNTEVKPVVSLSKFKERDERLKNRLKFGRHKITFRKPSDVANRAKQMLF